MNSIMNRNKNTNINANTHMKNHVKTLIKYLSLFFGVFVVLFPPYVIIVNAFKSTTEFNTSSTMALPQSFFNMENFQVVIERGRLLSGFANILLIIIVVLCLNILFGTMVAYVLGRFKFRGKKLVFGAYIIATAPYLSGEASFLIFFSLFPSYILNRQCVRIGFLCAS